MDTERRSIAETLMQRAVAGLSGEELLTSVKAQHPDATNQAIMRAAFFAVTRPHARAEQIPALYQLALWLRLELFGDVAASGRERR